MKSLIVVVALALMVLACGRTSAEIPAKTHDGRGGSECPIWPRHPSTQLCSPSLIRLIARGEDYDGKRIAVSGRLVKSNENIYLCPGLELCAGDWSSAIQLPDSPDIAKLADDSNISMPVRIIGKYSANTRGKEGQVAGILLTVDAAYIPVGP